MNSAGRRNRRRGEASPEEGLALAGGPSDKDGICVGRPQRKEESGLVLLLPGAPGSRQRRIDGNAAAAKKEHSNQGACAVETEGASGDHSQLVIESFDEAVGEFRRNVSEDAGLVLTNRPCDLDEGFELGAGSPGEPTLQLAGGVIRGGFQEYRSEGFLEQVSAIEGCIVLLDSGEFVPLFVGKVPRVFEQGVPGLFDRSGFFSVVDRPELPNFFSPHVVDSFGCELEDVEEVVNDFGFRCLVPNGLGEGGGHIDGDDFDLLGPLLPELFEECVEGFGALTLFGPDDAARFVVDDSGNVAMVLSIAEFVHADALEAVESFRVELVGNDAFYDVAHGAPGDAHHFCDLCLVGNLCEIGGHLFEGPGEAAPRPRPWDHLHADAAVRALYAPRSVFEDEPHRADTEMYPPDRFAAMVVPGTYPPALRAARQTPGRLHRQNDTIFPEVDSCNEKTGNPNQNSGKLCDAHVSPLLSEVLVDIQKHGKPCAFQFFGAD